MKIKYFFIVLAIFSILLEAKTLTTQEINQMPTSIEKDYYIWRFISQPDTTQQEAYDALIQASYINKTIADAYKNKTGSMPRIGAYCKGRDCTPPPPSNNTVQANRRFAAGIKAVAAQDLQTALSDFIYSKQVTDKVEDRDRATFWAYLLSKDKTFLNELLNSQDVNMYTLIAHDMANDRYPKTITPSFALKNKYSFNENDPINWALIKEQVFSGKNNLDELAQSYAYESTAGYYAFIKSYASQHKEIYYPLPYRDMLQELPIERQALIYGIARQESHFIPASVSHSFALGMMQIMPFLVNYIAKKDGESIDLDDMFDPYKALQYSNRHLNYLNSYLYHPLFVAYAYNGGMGFTKRLIQRPDMFKSGPFEPYLSMERIENIESREYGKKVLTNYVIYMNKLGISTRILPLINKLNDGTQIDRFRN
ncbi:MAG: lytic transglycosylase domain-containing protein [Sulfurovaceae bacterium]|nr:lytic transglycosylase domain-containing protein [Sulfurovaceae bacterium]